MYWRDEARNGKAVTAWTGMVCIGLTRIVLACKGSNVVESFYQKW